MNLTAVAVTEAAPAKLNLALHVTGQRQDGYHLIESLVVFTGVGDTVTARPSPFDDFSVEGDFADAIPMDSTNLVIKARDLLRRSTRGSPKETGGGPVGLSLDKNLPVASGIGGGSSDAAATLRSLAKLWNLDMAPSALAELGKSLGADVPMCVVGRPLIAKGIGEIIHTLPRFPALNLVLVNPGVAVSTPAVFKALASRANSPLPPHPCELSVETLVEWLAATRNDLEAPALKIASPIDEALAALCLSGAAFARMSGSGATCFGLFRHIRDAEAAAAEIRRARPGWFVAATETLAAAGENNAGH